MAGRIGSSSLLFGIGALAMRGAGCTFNDIADRDFDKAVERTRAPADPERRRSRSARRLCSWRGELAVGARCWSASTGWHRSGLRRAAADRHLSLHEAHHLLAAILPGTEFQLGRADGLGGGERHARLARATALCRRHCLDAGLRHHLRAPGQGGRRADRRQILRLGARAQHAAFPVRLLRRGGGVCGRGRATRRGSGSGSGSRSAWRAAQLAWQAGAVVARGAAAIASPNSNRTARWAGCCWRASSPRMSFRITRPSSAPIRWWRRRRYVPEIRLHLASEVTPLWQATEAALEQAQLPPPYWAFAWPGGQALARHILDHPEVVRGQNRARFRRRMRAGGDRRGAGRGARVTAAEPDAFAMPRPSAMNAALNGCRGRDRDRRSAGARARSLAGRAGGRHVLRAALGRAAYALARELCRARARWCCWAIPAGPICPRRARTRSPIIDVPTSLELEDKTSRDTLVLRADARLRLEGGASDPL